MTGFARMTGRVSDELGYSLILKSVNHRFLDLHLRLPSNTDALEMRLRRGLKEKLARGHVELTLVMDRSTKTGAGYDPALVAGYIAAFRDASQAHGLLGEPDLNAIFRLPGVLSTEARSRNDGDMPALEEAVIAQLDALVEALNAMRAQEGASLVKELRSALDRLATFVEEAAALREDIQQAYFERVSERVGAMLSGSFDRDRILQEAALIAERSDVEEEVARMRAHIEHFRSMLEEGGEVGKKLDFLLQEMNREANTLLSKTSGIAGNGPRVTELGLGMKSEIEKAREQVQNLE